jgi:hypothetical protein
MRWIQGSIFGAAIFFAAFSSGTAQATTDCAAYSVAAPVIGSKTGTPCAPAGNPGGFTVSHTAYDCGGITPLSTTWCVTVTVWLPV